jgi:hypothetical protein
VVADVVAMDVDKPPQWTAKQQEKVNSILFTLKKSITDETGIDSRLMDLLQLEGITTLANLDRVATEMLKKNNYEFFCVDIGEYIDRLKTRQQELQERKQARKKADTEAQAKAQAQAQAEAEAKAQAEAQAKAEALAQAKAQAKAEAEAKAQAEAKAEHKGADDDDDDSLYEPENESDESDDESGTVTT